MNKSIKYLIAALMVCLLPVALVGCKKPTTKNYEIKVITNQPDYGTVSGGGQYKKDTEVEISAIANEGCIFVQWDDGITAATRKVLAQEDKTYVAEFRKLKEYKLESLSFYMQFGTNSSEMNKVTLHNIGLYVGSQLVAGLYSDNDPINYDIGAVLFDSAKPNEVNNIANPLKILGTDSIIFKEGSEVKFKLKTALNCFVAEDEGKDKNHMQIDETTITLDFPNERYSNNLFVDERHDYTITFVLKFLEI